MAYANTNRIAQNGLADRFASLVAAWKLARQRRSIYNQTVRELCGLSDRDLTDLGLHRSMIAKIASEAAYGK